MINQIRRRQRRRRWLRRQHWCQRCFPSRSHVCLRACMYLINIYYWARLTQPWFSHFNVHIAASSTLFAFFFIFLHSFFHSTWVCLFAQLCLYIWVFAHSHPHKKTERIWHFSFHLIFIVAALIFGVASNFCADFLCTRKACRQHNTRSLAFTDAFHFLSGWLTR